VNDEPQFDWNPLTLEVQDPSDSLVVGATSLDHEIVVVREGRIERDPEHQLRMMNCCYGASEVNVSKSPSIRQNV